MLYNVPPLRLKDVPYADVLCESINNPIRLALGWYATGYGLMPPLSLMMAYWMFGAFLMAMKRFAEYRMINDPERAGRYRRSFRRYNQERLIESIFFYAAFFGMLSGIFMARYQVELVLATPLVSFTMAYYMHLGFKPNSAVQHPELLYRQKKLVVLVAISFAACTWLLFTDVPPFTSFFAPWMLPPR
jgi:4-hydroxybenzoate polyprenyltransferase